MHKIPKKRLGQNFLIDKNIRRKIVEALGLSADDIILEIGAGRGELTGEIAKECAKVYALELDSTLLGALRENLKGQSNVEIINQDILKFDFKEYFKNRGRRIKVVGNIPYYISSPILEHLFSYAGLIESICITVQKEFAQRLVAGAGSKTYGSLSCFAQYYSEPKIIFNIKRTSFYPAPKVDSCFLKMQIRKKTSLSSRKEEMFFKIVRAAFNQRRKTLRNSLEGIIPPEKLNNFFKDFGIDANTRPEMLSMSDFFNLINQ